jgi:hypothetical protein
MILHRHRCIRCGHVWQCAESNRSQPGHDICAICEALGRMRTEVLGGWQGKDRNTAAASRATQAGRTVQGGPWA